jgi:hypothetical protein
VQVLDFITSLTISVYHSLLRKHRGLPPAAPQPAGASAGALKFAKHVTAFGSSSTRSMDKATAAGVAKSAVEVAAAAVAGVRAKGQALPAMRKTMPTKPREVKRPAAHVFVIPSAPYSTAGVDTATSAAAGYAIGAAAAPSSSLRQQQQRRSAASSQLQLEGVRRAELAAADAERLEAWQGWRTATGTPVHGSRQAQQDSGVGCGGGIELRGGIHAEAAAIDGGAQDGLDTSRTSCSSDASSWQLQD